MRLPLAVLALLLVAPAAGQDGSVVDVDVTMHSEGEQHWFECMGPVCNEGRNPAFVLDRGKTYAFHVTNEADVQHDLHVGGVDASTRLLDPGEEEELRFTVPEDAEGNATYFCSIHPDMRGTVVFESPAVGGGPIDNDSPTPGLLLMGVVLGTAMLLVRWRWARD